MKLFMVDLTSSSTAVSRYQAHCAVKYVRCAILKLMCSSVATEQRFLFQLC
jgi:hypothetical protein